MRKISAVFRPQNCLATQKFVEKVVAFDCNIAGGIISIKLQNCTLNLTVCITYVCMICKYVCMYIGAQRTTPPLRHLYAVAASETTLPVRNQFDGYQKAL
ncbi:unnamed protein product [Ceratitis capitata]|uniref:(Mediterranean fruit fly) hypothetical protein n=1 Tax=Ceratitis capitata TaxID=7213 RepID=A0A811U318_CERCA|nr:unnamed protein product [Ceratitis capitata]